MRQGPLESTAALFGDVRAGRAAARSDVPGLKRRETVAEDPSDSLRCPGLTASFPAAQELCRRKKTATPAKPAWPPGGIASDAWAAQEWRSGEATRHFVVPLEDARGLYPESL